MRRARKLHLGQAVKRYQDFHETLIPLLVRGIGAHSYLEFGTNLNETIGKVVCDRRYGVDLSPKEDSTITQFAMSTSEFIKTKAVEHGPFDFVFIDADHRFASVQDDFFGILPFVSGDGLICLHDTNPETEGDTVPEACADSWRFVAMLVGMGFETVTLPYHPGLTIVRKRIQWGPA